MGTYGSLASYGLGLNSGSLVSEGRAERMNWVVRYNTVQEQSTTNWSSSTVGPSVKMNAAAPVVNLRFTGWSVLGGGGQHYSDEVPGSSATAAFSHCRFAGGEFIVFPGSVGLTNSLWERVYVKLRDGEDDEEWFLFNNLFYGGTLYYRALADTVLRANDNLFDATTITKGAGSALFAHDYNGYVTNQNRLTPNATNDVILTNSPVYQTSYLDRYYYPTNDGRLSLLINAGSRNADAAGLYHFTVRPDQTKETTSVVDIGYHYVATDGEGNPQDYDDDGVPDYLEDNDGDGLPDWWELQYFGNLNQTGSGDYDSDGVSNLMEYLLGRNPLVGATGDAGDQTKLRVFTPLK